MKRPLLTNISIGLALLLATACLLLGVGHMGVDLGPISALGPGGTRVIMVPAVIFTVAAIAIFATTYFLFKGHKWAWITAIIGSGLLTLAFINGMQTKATPIGIGLSFILLLSLVLPTNVRFFTGRLQDTTT